MEKIEDRKKQAMGNLEKGRLKIKADAIAIVSDGSAVLGSGNVGGLAALPVLKEKAKFFKEFGNVDAFPICLDTQDTEEIVKTVKNIAPGFGGICLENISAPRCFEIEKKLKEEIDIPVFHDNQHGTAIVVSAAVINAFKFLGRPYAEAKTVICGAGTAGNAIAKMLHLLGVRDVVICDSKGILSANRIPEFGEDKLELLEFTNKEGISGGLKEAVKGRDLFIGVSKPGVLSEDSVRTMAKNPVIFALSNPKPEILPEAAKAAGAHVVGTGKASYPNQINNVLVFPGIFKGALDAGATDVTDDMKTAAAWALAGLVSDEELAEDHVLPSAAGEGVSEIIAKAVYETWLSRLHTGG